MLKTYGKVHSHIGTIVDADGKHFFTSGHDSILKAWNFKTNTIVHDYGEVHQSPVSSMAATNDGKFLYTSSADGTLKQWAVKEKGYLRLLRDYGEIHTHPIRSIIITPDDQYLFTSDEIGNLKQFELNGTMVHRNGSLRKNIVSEIMDFGELIKGPIFSMSASRDSQFLYVSSGEGYLKKIDIEEGTVVKDFGQIHQNIQSISATRDGRLLFTSGSVDKSIKVWDTKEGKLVKSLDMAHENSIFAIQVTADDKWLFSSDYDGNFKQWDIEKLELFMDHGHVHDGAIRRLAI